jgi:hypothetical protein
MARLRLWLTSAMGLEAAVAGTAASAAIVVLLLAGCSWCVSTRKSHHCGSIVVHVLVCTFDHMSVCQACSTGVHACRGLAQNYGRGTLQGFALVHGLQDTQKASVGVKIGRAYHIPTRRTVAFVPLVVVFCSGDGAIEASIPLINRAHVTPWSIRGSSCVGSYE